MKDCQPCPDTRAALRQQLLAVQDVAYGQFHSRLVPTIPRDSILGVRMPRLRAIAKDMSCGRLLSDGRPLDWRNLFTQWQENPAPFCYEEILTAGLCLSYAKMPIEERFVWIRRFVPMIDNWATCDTFAGTWKPAQQELPRLWEFLRDAFLRDLTADAAEYELRYGVVMLLTHFVKREEYIHDVLDICNAIDHPAYYVKMAVAWALSYAFIYFPKETIALFQSPDHHLDDFTYNKAIQKACESYRVPEETKEFLRFLRSSANRRIMPQPKIFPASPEG